MLAKQVIEFPQDCGRNDDKAALRLEDAAYGRVMTVLSIVEGEDSPGVSDYRQRRLRAARRINSSARSEISVRPLS